MLSLYPELLFQSSSFLLFHVIYLYYTDEEVHMLAVRMPAELEERLDRLAKLTGRTKTFYVREALE